MAYFDLSKFAPRLDPYVPLEEDEQQQPTAPVNNQGGFADAVDAFQAGAWSAAGGIADFVGAEKLAQNLYGRSQANYDEMSQSGREAMGKKIIEQDEQGGWGLGDGATDFDTWLLGFANMAGQFAATAIPGVGAAGAVGRAAGLAGKGKTAANIAGLSATGGSAATGQAMDQARQEYFEIPLEVKAQSAIFKTALQEVEAQNPQLAEQEKLQAADALVAQQIADEVRADPKVLLANFGASAIGDPVIGRALTGIRIAKGGIARSGAKGFAIEGSTEAAQAGVSELGVNQAVSQIDNRDPWQGVAEAAANEGILGGTFGGAIGAAGGFANRQPKPPAPTDAATEAVRQTNPTLAAEMDVLNTAAQNRSEQMQQVMADTGAQAAAETAVKESPVVPQKSFVEQRRAELEQALQQMDTTKPDAAKQVADINKQLSMLESDRSFASVMSLTAHKSYRDAVKAGLPVEIVPAKYKYKGNNGKWLEKDGFKWQQKAPVTDQAAALDVAPPQQSGSVIAPGNIPTVNADPTMLLPAEVEQLLSQPPTMPEVNTNVAEENAAMGAPGIGRESNLPDRSSEANRFPARDSGLQPQLPQPAAEPVANRTENTPVADASALPANSLINEQATDTNVGTTLSDQAAVTPSPETDTAPQAAQEAQAMPASEPAAEVEATPVQQDAAQLDNAEPAADLAGEAIDPEWTAFADDTGTKKIPRAEMPQIKAEHRGAMVQFMKGRDITHEQDTVPASDLKPTQAEFSPAKVKKAMEFDGGNRSILVSSDGYVLDGHHQWLAAREKGEAVDVIRLNAPIDTLIPLAREFPSSTVADGSTDAKQDVSQSENNTNVDADSGDFNIPLFSKANTTGTKPAKGVPISVAQREADRFVEHLSGAAGIKVQILPTQQDAARLWRMSLDGDFVRGAYSDQTGTVYIIAENARNMMDLRQTIAHELFAHGGLDKVIGADKKQEFLNRLKGTRSKKEFKGLWSQIDRDYDGMSEDVKAEELFAYFVQNQPQRGPVKFWWNAFKRWLNNILANLGITSKGDPDVDLMQSMMESIMFGFQFGRQADSNAEGGLAFNRNADYEKSKNQSFNNTIDSLLNGEVTEVEAALYHPDVGEIDLVIGEAGTAEKNYSDGFGLAKILIKHPEVNPYKLLDIVAGAKKTKQRGNTIELEDEKTKIVVKLDWQGEDKKWLLTAFEPASRSQSIDAAPGTSSDSTLSEVEAVNSIDESSDNEQVDLKFSRTRGEPDTRTAREKIGQAQVASQTISDRIKNTVDAIKDSSWWKAVGTRATEGIFDGLHGIKKAEEAVGVTDPNKMGYVSARLATGLGDMLHALFSQGALEWKGGVTSIKPGTKGLLEVFGMLPEGDGLNNWLAWMAANRAEKLMAEGRENNLTAKDIAELKALSKGNEALFEEVRKEYNKINSATLDLAEQAGLINADQRSGFDEEWYVPFFREMEIADPDLNDVVKAIKAPFTTKTGIVGQSANIKALIGGTQSTQDLLQNIIQRQVSMIDAAVKNNAAREVAGNLDGTGFMTREDSPEFDAAVERTGISRQDLAKRHQKVRIMENGKPVYYYVHDAALLRGLMQVHDVGSKALFNKMARSAKRFLTTGVTLSPDFIIRNFIRDAAHAWMVNKDGAKLGTDTWKGLKASWQGDPNYWKLIASGAAFQGGYIHGADPEAAQQQIRRALRANGMTTAQVDGYMATIVTSKDKLMQAFEKYRQASDKLENSNRMTVYERAIAAGKSERQALFESKDLMDYSLKGNFGLMGTLIDMLPFFNARLQGLYKLGRAAAAEGDDQLFKVLSRDLAMKGLKVAAFSTALAAMYGDDERYKKLAEWDKDAHWHFFLGEGTDGHIRIPKPFELGIVFGTFPERLFNFAAGNQSGKDAREAVGHAVFNTLALNPVPQLVVPVYEVLRNKSSFTGAPIETLADQQREKKDRYDERTSDVTRALGGASALAGLSPKQVEHLVTGYTGTLGGYVLGMADFLARVMTGREKASTPAADWPIVRTLYQGGKEQRNTMYQQRFIESLEKAREAYGSYKLAIDEQDPDRAQRQFEKRAKELNARLPLERIQRRVSDINKAMRTVERDTRLSSSEKKDRLQQLQRQKNELYEQAYMRLELRNW